MSVVALLRQTDVREFGYIDAIVGVRLFLLVFYSGGLINEWQTLWTAACQAFITELSRAQDSPEHLGGAVETLLAAMSVFSQDCRLIGVCLLSGAM